MKSRSNSKYYVLAGCLSSVLAIGALCSCSSSSDKGEAAQEEEALTVRTQTVKTETVDRKIQYTANLEANEQVYYAPTLAGSRIKKINVEVGDHVRKGQVLVEMDNNSLVQQELQLKNLETEYNRAVKLKESGSISQQNYDQIVTQYEVTKKAIENLKENTRMLAPFDGVVTGKYMEEGELYMGAALGGAAKPSIICIEQIKPMKAKVNVAEQYYLEVKKGMKVTLQNDIYGDRTFEGTVNIVYPTIDPSSRTFSVELKFNNPDEALRPGMYGTVSFATGVAKIKTVPSLAVLKMQGSNDRYMFKAVNGRAKRLSVRIVNRYDDKVEVVPLDGTLEDGDQIVSVGQGKLVDGSLLKIVD